ncbi:hypothetical protein [Aliiruegeria sabulilitoris]|uniref:hypothetical protein n=1 Tax=Aliiruegeria sabulilitoris TaxID=1510458 RepID=UPI0012E390E5|nr:hypothetical protein [Aliiruegeria sabulilitoris]NDR55824.1 hypothetical protein [Pseudoruegeria sp. M32A2M]
MIGYRVTAKAANNYVRDYSGWFEGSPTVESKAKEMAAKAVMSQMANLAAGGPVGTVASILSMPLQALGAGVGAVIAQNLLKINKARADMGMAVFDIEVTLSGDVQPAKYKLVDSNDLTELPKLLALIPQKGTTNKFLGSGVLEAAYMAHVNYARHLYNKGNWDASKQTQTSLSVHIDL